MAWTFELLHIHMNFLAPNDKYHVYKRGSTIRMNYSLLGFGLRANHANLSILLKEGHLYAINHDAKTVQDLTSVPQNDSVLDDAVNAALNYVMAHDVCAHSPYGWSDPATAPRFRREKEWFTGRKATSTLVLRGSDDNDEEQEFECAVYKTVGVQFESLIRSDPHAKQTRIPRSPKSDALLKKERALEALYFDGPTDDDDVDNNNNNNNDSNDEDSDSDSDSHRHHGGRKNSWRDGLVWESENITRMTRSFAGKLWMCSDYSMKMSALVPILSSLSVASPAFKYLHQFVSMLKMPDGFPLKIEIPVFFPVTAVAEMKLYEPLNNAKLPHDFFEIPAGYHAISEPYFGYETREMMKSVKSGE